MAKSSWTSILGKFRRESKKVKASQKSGAGAGYEPHWSLWPTLQFLKDKVDEFNNTSLCSVDGLFDQPEEENSAHNQQISAAAPTFAPTPSTSTAPDIMAQANELGNIQPSHDGEDVIFFNSLLTHVRRVDEKDKLLMRNKINQIVMEYAYPKKPERKPGFGVSPFYPYFFTPTINSGYFNHGPLALEQPQMSENKRKRPPVEEDDDCMIVGVARPTKVFVKEEKKNSATNSIDWMQMMNFFNNQQPDTVLAEIPASVHPTSYESSRFMESELSNRPAHYKIEH